jgi:Na+/H+ antiporter NhaA
MLIRINGKEIGKKVNTSEINSKLRNVVYRPIWKDYRVFGIVAPTLSTLLQFSPDMLIAYTIVCGVGVSLIGIGFIENMFISNGNTRTAEIIERVTKSILLGGTVIGITYGLFHLPMWNWG